MCTQDFYINIHSTLAHRLYRLSQAEENLCCQNSCFSNSPSLPYVLNFSRSFKYPLYLFLIGMETSLFCITFATSSKHRIIGRLIYKTGTKYAYVNALQNCSILNIRIVVVSLMCSLCLTQYIGLD